MKHEVAELEGALLDAAVVLALGGWGNEIAVATGCCSAVNFRPSLYWEHGGQIIERERLHCIPASPDGWASFADDWGTERVQYGPTPLIAAMRAFVCSKLGDEIELPD